MTKQSKSLAGRRPTPNRELQTLALPIDSTLLRDLRVTAATEGTTIKALVTGMIVDRIKAAKTLRR